MKRGRGKRGEAMKGNRFQGASKVKANSKGITLVALVVTIIILIILATVAINFAFGNNGLIKRAEDARGMYANDTKYTEDSITNVESYIDGIVGESSGGGSDMPDEWDPSKVTAVESEDGVTVPVPIGFTASEATGEKSVNDGFVIYQGTDSVNDENVYNAQRSRNQFVWIPVDEESIGEMYETVEQNLSQSDLGEAVTTTTVYSKLRYTSSAGLPGSKDNREPDILTDTIEGDASTTDGRGINLIRDTLKITGSSNAEILKNFAQAMVDEYIAVYNSIERYGGFYIGRYEITGTMTSPTVIREKDVLTADSSQAGNWYGLKKACTELVSTNEVQSIMIYGNQWDEVMDWLVDTGDKTELDIYINSKTWGNYSDSSGQAAVDGYGRPQQSGYSDYWCANNIYDLAGNYCDNTQEADGSFTRIYRGRFWRHFRIELSSFRSQRQFGLRPVPFQQRPFSSSSFVYKVGLRPDRAPRWREQFHNQIQQNIWYEIKT